MITAVSLLAHPTLLGFLSPLSHLLRFLSPRPSRPVTHTPSPLSAIEGKKKATEANATLVAKLVRVDAGLHRYPHTTGTASE
jgi:hypothetical protein